MNSSETGKTPAAVTAPTEHLRREAMRFVRREAGFAQVCTVNTDGYPVTRTMGAPVNDDWTVELIQRRIHARLAQLRQNPRLEIVWVGAPAPGSTNDHPHVFDFGLLVPRVVLLRGRAEFMPAEWTIRRFTETTSRHRALGQTRAPERDADNVRTELVGIRVHPVRIRLEGFGTGAQAYTWTIKENR